MHTKSEVAVIGGGLSGLAAAMYLNQKGISFDLFEENDVLGGRVATEIVDGFKLDKGFQIFLDSYEEAKAIIDFESLSLKAAGSGALVRIKGEWRKFGNPLKKPLDVFPTLFSGIGSFWDKILIFKLSRFVGSKTQEDFQNMPNISTLQFLKNYGFSGNIIENFFIPFFGGVFLEFDLKTSSRLFLYLFKKFSEGDATLPQNGMKAIVQAMLDQLPAGSIHLGKKINSIESETIKGYSQIILAVNENRFQELTNNANSLKFNGTTCFYFSAAKMKMKDLNYLHLNPQGDFVKHVCFLNRIQPNYAPGEKELLSVTVSQGLDVQHQDVAKELIELFDGVLEDLKFLRKYEIPEALSFYDGEFKEQNKQKDGPIYCGDHMLYPSINGAIKSGRLAAEEVINRLA